MTLPNFLVIGAGRSGTTSLHRYLGEHPDVFVPPGKSPNHFVAHERLPPWEGVALERMARQWVSDRRDYEALFDGVSGETAIGEVSPVYLQARSAPAAIRETCPDVRLVAILRNPVDRAYAHFLGRRRDGLERRTRFDEVVAAELARGLPDEVAFGSYLGCGRYHHFLKPYYELFAAERIRIYLFEDLQEEPAALLRDLFAFLGVDPNVAPDTTERHGRTGEIPNPALRFLWTRSVVLRTALRPHVPARLRDLALPVFARELTQPPLDPSLRAELLEVFRDDVERLGGLIGRDLSYWLSGSSTRSQKPR